MDSRMDVLLLAASLAGLANAVVFTAMAWGRLDSGASLVRSVCRLDRDDCQKVLNSPRARVFGVPNSLLGAVWYAVTAACAALHIRTGRLPLPDVLIGVSAVTVALSAYLAWSLIARLRVRCGFCFAGHVANCIILAALLVIRHR